MTAEKVELSIARDFTRTPGPRKRADGEYSGEAFLQEHLRNRFKEALDVDSMLRVNLDGVAGYPTSFLEESFGGLAREFGPDLVNGHLEFISEDEPYLEAEIRKYIREARKQR